MKNLLSTVHELVEAGVNLDDFYSIELADSFGVQLQGVASLDKRREYEALGWNFSPVYRPHTSEIVAFHATKEGFANVKMVQR